MDSYNPVLQRQVRSGLHGMGPTPFSCLLRLHVRLSSAVFCNSRMRGITTAIYLALSVSEQHLWLPREPIRILCTWTLIEKMLPGNIQKHYMNRTSLTLHSPVMACGMSRSLGFEFIHICIYIIQFGRNVPAPRQNKNRGYQCTKKKVSMKAFVYDDVRLYTPMDDMRVAEASREIIL